MSFECQCCYIRNEKVKLEQCPYCRALLCIECMKNHVDRRIDGHKCQMCPMPDYAQKPEETP